MSLTTRGDVTVVKNFCHSPRSLVGDVCGLRMYCIIAEKKSRTAKFTFTKLAGIEITTNIGQ